MGHAPFFAFLENSDVCSRKTLQDGLERGKRFQPPWQNSSAKPGFVKTPGALPKIRQSHGPRTKKPEPSRAREYSPVSFVPKFSAVTRDTLLTGRSSDSRIVLVVQPFPLANGRQWASQDFRPR